MSIEELTAFHQQLHDLFTLAAIKLKTSERRDEVLDHIQQAMYLVEQQITLKRVGAL